MAGDASRWRSRTARSRFNPRPPISWRATQLVANEQTRAEFQSTPTNFMAGDLTFPSRRVLTIDVSIHAHQFHGGRRGVGLLKFAIKWFQSTPTNFMAGDSDRTATACASRGFNPRPPISWRATTRQRRTGLRSHVSIHAHQFHGGRPHERVLAGMEAMVSIHAHQFHGGRHEVQRVWRPNRSFQSTPTNFMAGDLVHADGWNTHFRFQSTPTNFMAGDKTL